MPIDIYQGLLGTPQGYGLLSDEEKAAAQRAGLMNFGASMLASSGPSATPNRLGPALGQAMIAGQTGQSAQIQQALNAALLKKQMAQAERVNTPSAVNEYEYAKANGFKGTFDEWKRIAAAKPAVPAGIQEYEYFSKLTPEEQQKFLSIQRSPVVPQVGQYNGGLALIDRVNKSVTPLSTAESEGQAAATKARLESEAKGIGSAVGDAKGALQKKAINAMNVIEMVDLADPLVEVATGSGPGAAADKVAGFFGKSLDGDQAIAQLQILQANMMLNMPRMEGPQSDRDAMLYKEAAGQIGDPTAPRERKKAALKTIRDLQQKYAEVAEKPEAGGQPKKQTAAERAKAMGL